jgi:hypothetical protein
VVELTVLIAARNEAERIGETVRALRAELGDAEILVVDGASTDGTASAAEEAGAVVLRLEERGKGEALSAGERVAAPGPLLLCDADLRGSLTPLAEGDADLRVAAFTHRVGGGFGIAKRFARELIHLRTGFKAREPLSGQRRLSERARAACFPLAPGFGCEVRMTIDALRAGLSVEEVDLDLDHRATGRDAAGFAHRGRQLLDALLAAGPLGVNHRGKRLPLIGWLAGVRLDPAVGAVAAIGLADDVWSGEERGIRAHLAVGGTTGAQGIHRSRVRPGRAARSGRPPPSLRSPRESDAGGRGIECAWGPARLQVRGPNPRMGSLGSCGWGRRSQRSR